MLIHAPCYKIYCNEKLHDEPEIDHAQSIIHRWGIKRPLYGNVRGEKTKSENRKRLFYTR